MTDCCLCCIKARLSPGGFISQLTGEEAPWRLLVGVRGHIGKLIRCGQGNQGIATPLIQMFCPGELLMEEQAGITAPLCLCLCLEDWELLEECTVIRAGGEKLMKGIYYLIKSAWKEIHKTRNLWGARLLSGPGRKNHLSCKFPAWRCFVGPLLVSSAAGTMVFVEAVTSWLS